MPTVARHGSYDFRETLVALAGLKQFTIKDLEKAAGVSRSTMHRLLTSKGIRAFGLLPALPKWMNAMQIDNPEERGQLMTAVMQTVFTDECAEFLEELIGLLSMQVEYREALALDLRKMREAVQRHRREELGNRRRLDEAIGIGDHPTLRDTEGNRSHPDVAGDET